MKGETEMNRLKSIAEQEEEIERQKLIAERRILDEEKIKEQARREELIREKLNRLRIEEEEEKKIKKQNIKEKNIRKEKFLFTTGLVDVGTECIFRFKQDVFYDHYCLDSDDDDRFATWVRVNREQEREKTIDQNIAIINNIGLENIEFLSHRSDTLQNWGTGAFKENYSIINRSPIFDIRSEIVVDLMNLEWIFLVQPYITKIHMNSLACCCKKLNAYIAGQVFYSPYNTIIMPFITFDCTFCGENCKENFIACDDCMKLYKMPICVGNILTVEKSRIFPCEDHLTLDCKPIVVPDSYVCHLKDIIPSKYEYWKLAINCVNLALREEIYNPKWCKN